jgi:hypothetical protein
VHVRITSLTEVVSGVKDGRMSALSLSLVGTGGRTDAVHTPERRRDRRL